MVYEHVAIRNFISDSPVKYWFVFVQTKAVLSSYVAVLILNGFPITISSMDE